MYFCCLVVRFGMVWPGNGTILYAVHYQDCKPCTQFLESTGKSVKPLISNVEREDGGME